jgi:hypothetical protein
MPTEDHDFIDFSLIGFVICTELLTKMVESGIISASDAADVVDHALLSLESWQGGFPYYQRHFESARDFLAKYLAAFRSIPKSQTD